MKSNTNHVIIMAWGIGSRFWPMSTPERPKQFIDVLGCGRTLIQLTADRFKGVCPPEHIWVVTSKSFASLVREQLPEIPEENILLEPCMRFRQTHRRTTHQRVFANGGAIRDLSD